MAARLSLRAWGLYAPETAPVDFPLWPQLKALVEWCAIVALLGYARTVVTRGGPALRWASEIAYPFYLWHQTAIVVLAYVVLRLDLPVWSKFVLLATSALVASVVLCELVRATNPTRFLFGMKPRVEPVAPPTAEDGRAPRELAA